MSLPTLEIFVYYLLPYPHLDHHHPVYSFRYILTTFPSPSQLLVDSHSGTDPAYIYKFTIFCLRSPRDSSSLIEIEFTDIKVPTDFSPDLSHAQRQTEFFKELVLGFRLQFANMFAIQEDGRGIQILNFSRGKVVFPEEHNLYSAFSCYIDEEDKEVVEPNYATKLEPNASVKIHSF